MNYQLFLTLKALCRLMLFFTPVVICAATLNFQVQAQNSSSNRPVARLISSMDGRSLGSTSSSRRVLAASRAEPVVTDSSGFISEEEKRAFQLVNAQRAEKGLQPLIMDVELSRMARAHSTSMSSSNFLNHVGTDGRDTFDRARERGITGWSAMGENIAYNQGYPDPEAFAVDRWMNSGKHRSNILNAMFTRTGIGIARSADGTTYFTQVFMAR